MSNIIEIIKILLIEPDPSGLNLITSGKLTREGLINSLRNSKEYKNRFHKTINLFENFPRNSGYGILGNNVYKALIKYSYKINNIRYNRKIGNHPINVPNSYISIILSIPLHYFKTNSKLTVGYTMFETNRIPSSWIPGCNQVDRLFVPIKSNVDTFKNCGVKVPIDIIPIGIDTDIYNPSITGRNFNFGNNSADSKAFNQINLININNKYKFLVINDGQVRKNNNIIINAFQQEFRKEIERGHILLMMRLSHRNTEGPGIYNIDRYIDDRELPLLINSCDCMINVASGECGDIPILEAMAMEKPVIVSDDHLLHSEIIEEGKNGFLVDIDKWEPAFIHPSYINQYYLVGLSDAKWVVPSINDLKKKMRFVYENRDSDIIAKIGKDARQYILQNRTKEIAINKMIEIFDKF